MHNRQLLRLGEIDGADARTGVRLIPVTGEELQTRYVSQIISPIIADGEVVGCVVLMGREGEHMGDVEAKDVYKRQAQNGSFIYPFIDTSESEKVKSISNLFSK